MKRFSAGIASAALITTLAIGISPAVNAVPVSGVAALPAVVPEMDCSVDYAITDTLKAGTSWNLCWRVEDRRGLVLSDVSYQSKIDAAPIPVVDEIGLAQMNVPYDYGWTFYDDLTEYGFGGTGRMNMTEAECPNGQILDLGGASGTWNLPTVCVTEESSGVAYHSQNITDSGTDLVLTMLSSVGWYEYVTEYRFHDDGEIGLRTGATGDISPWEWTNETTSGWPIGAAGLPDNVSSNHFHNAFWRIDFGIGGQGDQIAQRIDVDEAPALGGWRPQFTSIPTDLLSEQKAVIEEHDAYRVLNPSSLNADGRPRSYEIVVPQGLAYNKNPQTDYDLAFTQYNPKQLFSSDNWRNIVEAPGNEVTDFAADQETMTDPVVWVNSGFHHIVRDEDQSPMPIHWQGFSLYPRDFTAQSPVVPESRADVNGRPGSGYPDRVRPGGGGGYEAIPLLSPIPNEPDASTNLGLYGTAHVGSYAGIGFVWSGGPQNINDGNLDSDWNGDAWPRPTTATYKWSQAITAQRVVVDWVRMSGGYNLDAPSAWQLEYLAPGGVWSPVALTSGSYEVPGSGPGEVRTPADLSFEPVSTTSLRITSHPDGERAIGLWEWQVFSKIGSTATPEPTAPATSEPSSEPTVTPTPSSTTPAVPDGGPQPVEPTPGTTASVATDVIAVGAIQKVTATGFAPGEPVVATLYSTPINVVTIVSDDDGNVNFEFTVPEVDAGEHTLELVGQRSGRVATTTFQVVEPAGIAQWLAMTGLTGGPLRGIGIGLLISGAGTLVILMVRSRRQPSIRIA